MDRMLRFDNQVALITGAGGGLGKAYALMFAMRGAKVVVNDLGGDKVGTGKSNSNAADSVVKEIKRNGGIAVADYNSVEEGDKIIKTALDNFGRIDILVNNAGILRDKSFARISDTDWDLVLRIHLLGSFRVTRAAFSIMKKQNYGRIIMTSSVAGIYGNFGQANYSAAKLGLLGLSNTIAIEGKKYGIHCNTIAPMSGTRLTEGILPPDLFEQFSPELISPIVLWLCHHQCDETGGLFEAAGGWFGKYRWERSKGFTCRKSLLEKVTPEAVRDNWDKISDFSHSLHIGSNSEAAAALAQVLEDLKEKDSKNVQATFRPNVTGPMAAVGISNKDVPFTYDTKDVILYALGVGASIKDTPQYVYEGNENFQVLPTFAILPSQAALIATNLFTRIPGWDVDVTKLVHGEHYLQIIRPLDPSATLFSDIVVTDVLDKGSGALVLVDIDTYDELKDPVAKSQYSLFVLGEGGFGGSRSSSKQVPLAKRPHRNPDAVETAPTSVDQAALYRLSGDRNPLHIDPEFAALGGFAQPILHGLCSFGFAARAVLKHFCDCNVANFKAIKSRFSKPVIPGQTLVTSMWLEGNRVYFETTVQEKDQLCLSGGYVDIAECNEVKKRLGKELKCDSLFQNIAQLIESNKVLSQSNRDLILWIITEDGKIISEWTFDFQSTPIIYKGPPSNGRQPISTITLEEDDLMALFAGKFLPQKLFLNRKMKLTGIAPNFRDLAAFISSMARL